MLSGSKNTNGCTEQMVLYTFAESHYFLSQVERRGKKNLRWGCVTASGTLSFLYCVNLQVASVRSIVPDECMFMQRKHKLSKNMTNKLLAMSLSNWIISPDTSRKKLGLSPKMAESGWLLIKQCAQSKVMSEVIQWLTEQVKARPLK